MLSIIIYSAGVVIVALSSVSSGHENMALAGSVLIGSGAYFYGYRLGRGADHE
jgi:hypothetical protein